MRTLPAPLLAALSEDATQFCHCWWITRKDGYAIGLTDHDKPVQFEAKSFDPTTAIKVTTQRQNAGFDPGSALAEGALSHDNITEADILAGLWDEARIELWLVSFADVSLRLLLDVAALSDIRRRDGVFTAELKGVMQRLEEVQGRRYLASCDATLGDRRCGVDLQNSAFRMQATLFGSPEPRQLVALTPSSASALSLDGGFIERANGERLFIRSHVRLDGRHRLQLFEVPDPAIVDGELVTLIAGCNKHFRTCRDVFGNAANFRGFPHIPGSSFVIGAQKPGNGLVGPRE